MLVKGTPCTLLLIFLQGSLAEWYQVFLLAGLVNVVGGLVYTFFGKCDLQSWAEESQEVEEGEKKARLLGEEEERC